MRYCLITFRSVTPAQRGEGCLRKAGISCILQRTPRWMEEQGCGYSLRIPGNEAAHCAQLLRREGIPFRKVYLYRENGNTEELSV